jgi:hypothetical protein
VPNRLRHFEAAHGLTSIINAIIGAKGIANTNFIDICDKKIIEMIFFKCYFLLINASSLDGCKKT